MHLGFHSWQKICVRFLDRSNYFYVDEKKRYNISGFIFFIQKQFKFFIQKQFKQTHNTIIQ
jgi:hypothetical protein